MTEEPNAQCVERKRVKRFARSAIRVSVAELRSNSKSLKIQASKDIEFFFIN